MIAKEGQSDQFHILRNLIKQMVELAKPTSISWSRMALAALAIPLRTVRY